jgi:drug/metabolite transporter (DMT)-like permease
LGYILANDPILKSQMICMVGCFIGVIVLTTANHNQFNLQKGDHTDGNIYLGILFAMMCSWGFSFVIVAMRYLKEIHYSLMLFYYSFTATSFYFVYLTYEYFSSPSSQMVPRIF